MSTNNKQREKLILLQYSAVTYLVQKQTQQFSIQNEIDVTFKYSTFKELQSNYVALRHKLTKLIKKQFIDTINKSLKPEQHVVESDVNLIFNMYEFIYDSERDGVLPYE